MSNNLKESIELVDKQIARFEITDWLSESSKSVILKDLKKIRSLLQQANEGKEVVVNSNDPLVVSCPKCEVSFSMKSIRNKISKCDLCDTKIIWPEQQEETKEEAFEVVEYKSDEKGFLTTHCPNGVKTNMTDEQLERFAKYYKDKLIKVGSASCKEDCPHFQGHHVEGESIRCSAKKVGG